jgi:hypothetical protein
VLEATQCATSAVRHWLARKPLPATDPPESRAAS